MVLTETLVDESGIEIAVSYEQENTPAYEAEPGNPGTRVERLTCTELKYVEVCIKGRGIDILPLMHPDQKEWIVAKLQESDYLNLSSPSINS